MSNISLWKNVIHNYSSRLASIWVTRPSKYSLTPVNDKLVRAGRIERGGGGRRPSRGGRDQGNLKSCLSLVNAERQVAIASGEKHPE